MAQCEVCGTEMIQGRGRARRTCSAACRQAAHRRRQADELTALRAAATQPPADTPRPSRNDPDSPAGRIRTAGETLAAAAEQAAAYAEEGAYRDESLALLSSRYSELVAAVTAAMPADPGPSRNDPAPAPTPKPSAPAPRPAPRRPAAARTSRDEPAPTGTAGIEPRPQKLPKKRAMAVVEAAELVRHPDYRENHRSILRSGETVLGHVEPSYGGASRSGRNGWVGLLPGEHTGRPLPTRDAAAAELARRWLQLVTAAPRRV